jgi:hypothetical protein
MLRVRFPRSGLKGINTTWRSMSLWVERTQVPHVAARGLPAFAGMTSVSKEI